MEEDNAKDILKTLEPLFTQAEKEGLWFISSYQSILFTPNELREAQAEGRFIWGFVNWKLINPQDEIDRLEKYKVSMIKNTNDEIEDIKQRMKK